jgi:2-beta-glucuronyltransferase
MKKVILVTGHYFQSKRKAGFHWLAEAFWHLGWEVFFMTAPISFLSLIRQDYRFEYPIFQEARKLIEIRPYLWSYVWFTCWHPANLRHNCLNQASTYFWKKYSDFSLGKIQSIVQEADLFIFESTPALLLFEQFKHLNPQARYIYRVSDDLRLLSNHPVVLETEQNIAPRFDLVSATSAKIFSIFSLDNTNVKLHYHGIQKQLFNADCENPYLSSNCLNQPNVIFIGNSFFDDSFLEIASRNFPDWNFHIIGPIKQTVKRKNVIFYGELPFEDTIPHLKSADIGLQTRSYSPHIDSLSDTLKVIQYTYCKLPIIAPSYLKIRKSHIFHYNYNEVESIRSALKNAINYDRSQIDTSYIYSWEETVELMLEDLPSN